MTLKIALALAALIPVALATAGCGGDDCTRAEDHKAECFPTATTSSTGGAAAPNLSCAGAYQCQSQCINQYTCPQIQGNDPKFLACITKCGGQ